MIYACILITIHNIHIPAFYWFQVPPKKRPMLTYKIPIFEPLYTAISSGIKKVDIRICRGLYTTMKEGDHIWFENNESGYQRMCKTCILKIMRYSTFEEAIHCEGLSLEAVDTFSLLSEGGKKGDEERCGVVAVHVCLF